MPLQPGRTVDRYVVEALLGQGGMASVYRVRHVQLGSLHALKVLTIPAQPIRDRLLQEGRVQAALRHLNTVTVTDVVEVDGAPGLVMEFIGGPSLDVLLNRHRLSLEQADALAVGIIGGVAAAHRHGLIHRDLKPANVLLAVTDAGLVPKVADFGLAKLLSDDGGDAGLRTRSGVAMGTPQYMAPEQIRDAKGVDRRADVFSLGVMLYEMVCGQRPFEGKDLLDIFNAVSSGSYVQPRTHCPDLPEHMVRAISGALVVDRDRRISDCDRLLAAWKGVEYQEVAGAARISGPWSGSMMADVASMSAGSHEPTRSAPAEHGGEESVSVERDLPPRATWSDEADAEPAARRVAAATAHEGSLRIAAPASASEGRLRARSGESVGEHAVTLPPPSPRTAPDSMAPPADAVARRESKSGGLRWLVFAGGLGLLGAITVAVVAAVVFLARSSGEPAAEVVEAPAPAVQEQAPATVEAVAPPSVEAPTPVTAPQPPTEAPVASRRAARVDRSTNTTSAATSPPTSKETPPAPIAAEAEKPASTPGEPPAAPTTDPSMATVLVKGDAKRVWLESPAGRFPAGQVPPGTYQIKAFFDGVDAVTTGSITVKAGEVREIKCVSALVVCR